MNKLTLALVIAVTWVSGMAKADSHFDIAPYFQDGKILTGGLDHAGNHTNPPLTVYGFEFGEDLYDPFNPSDPGVNQAAGAGNLPSGAAINYNILSNLLYWEGSGEVDFGSPGEASIHLLMGTQSRIIDADSGVQAGSYIQAVLSDGSVHKHFTTSLYAIDGAGNVPDIGDSTYLEPDAGIYAFSIELTLTQNGTTYVSDPLWLVFNNGMSEEIHGAAMAYFAPEPATMSLLGLGAVALLRRKR